MTSGRAAQLRVMDAQHDTHPAAQELTLVDADGASEPRQEVMRAEEAAELQQLQRVQPRAPSIDATAALTLSPGNLERVREAHRAFENVSSGDPAEQLLEHLLAGEAGVSGPLQDLEAAAVVLLGRVITDPQRAAPVAKVTRHDEGEKIVEVTMADILELADLAEQTRKGNLQMLAMLRENRERMLACAVDREATERWIESTTARLVESDQFDARQLEQYREILESRAEWRWKWAGGAGHGC